MVFYLCIYATCTCCRSYGPPPPFVHHPIFFPPACHSLFSPFVLRNFQPPSNPAIPTLPYTRFLHVGILECCFITLFSSSIIHRRKVYIHKSVHARIYSRHIMQQRFPLRSSMGTWTSRASLMTRAETPANLEARPNCHTTKPVRSVESVPGIRIEVSKRVNEFTMRFLFSCVICRTIWSWGPGM